MAFPHYRSQFGDTTLTKVFVGGLAWETQTDVMRRYFEQFGEILEAVIITDRNTGRSKGYGFVTFRDPDSARRACVDPNPVIDGRRANCNIASFGRPRPSPPRGRNQGGNPCHGGEISYGRVTTATPTSSLPTPPPPPPPPPPPRPLMYPPQYGYATYAVDYGYHQSLYNPQLQSPQYYHQMYGASSSTVGSPYYYGYSLQVARGPFYAPQAHRVHGQSYLHYPTQLEGSFTTFPSPPPPPLPPLQSAGQHLPLSTDSQTPPQSSTEVGATVSESSNS